MAQGFSKGYDYFRYFALFLIISRLGQKLSTKTFLQEKMPVHRSEVLPCFHIFQNNLFRKNKPYI